MYILLILTICSFTSFAESNPSEEAIILNQEMQFLEESAQNVQIVSVKESRETSPQLEKKSQGLEEEYFGTENTQTIRSKASAPKRRSF
jgi:hypothetical protein